jgi:hypothetical protein
MMIKALMGTETLSGSMPVRARNRPVVVAGSSAEREPMTDRESPQPRIRETQFIVQCPVS